MIETCGLTRRFGGTLAVDAFDLMVPRSARVAILGPSGCGKTTLLRMIAGLEAPDGGEVRIGGAPVSGAHVFVPPHRRDLGVVFQEAALFPHMTVAGNVAYGVRGPAKDRRRRVAEMLEAVGSAELAGRRPDELSGGQQRRVALARALAPRPARLLMDEPLTNLDPAARDGLLALMDSIVDASGASLLYVTHDAGEAEALGCEMVRMEAGRRVP